MKNKLLPGLIVILFACSGCAGLQKKDGVEFTEAQKKRDDSINTATVIGAVAGGVAGLIIGGAVIVKNEDKTTISSSDDGTVISCNWLGNIAQFLYDRSLFVAIGGAAGAVAGYFAADALVKEEDAAGRKNAGETGR